MRAKSQLREHQTGFDHSFEPPPNPQPNPTMTGLHDRMPVILKQVDWPAWLGEVEDDPVTLVRPFWDNAEGPHGQSKDEHAEEQWARVVAHANPGVHHRVRMLR